MGRQDRLQGADAARFGAAASIVLFHLAWLSQMQLPPYLSFIKYDLGFGVPFFYMLSGFALCVGYDGVLDTPTQIKEFYLRRLARIAPLFWFLLVTYPLYNWLRYSVPIPSFTTFALNAAFIFNFFPGYASGVVPASWSIGVEMPFYAVLPAILCLTRGINSALALFSVSWLVSLAWLAWFRDSSPSWQAFANFSIIAHMKYFSAGMLTYFLWRSVHWTPLLHRACAALASIYILLLVAFSQLITLALVNSGFRGDFASYAVSSMWIPGLALSVAALSVHRFESSIARAIATMGKASFSIYLWHPIIIAELIHAGAYKRIQSSFASPLLIFVLSLALTLLFLFPVSWFSYAFIERHSERKRARFLDLYRRFSGNDHGICAQGDTQ